MRDSLEMNKAIRLFFIITILLLTECIKKDYQTPQTQSNTFPQKYIMQPDFNTCNDTFISDYYPSTNFANTGRINSAAWIYANTYAFYQFLTNFDLLDDHATNRRVSFYSSKSSLISATS